MKEINSNINIIGGGLIGALTAYSLSKVGLKISLVERNPVFNEKKYTDKRTTAISEGTKKFFESTGLWGELKAYCQPINKIKVIDRKLSNQLEFDNNRRKSNLGYIIKNNSLLNTVYSKIKNYKNIKIFNDFEVFDFQNENDQIITYSDKIKISSDLNIAADGKKSFVRNYFKTPVYSKSYKKSALVVTFTHTKSHNDTAFEIFYKNGPLAILPMKKNKGAFASSIVWTNEKDFLSNLIQDDNKNLIPTLNRETQNCVGEIKNIISRQIFDLNAHLNSRFFENRTIYIGDAAHSFHPIAGQGWNLGMKDVENLYKLLSSYKSLGIDPGDSFFCKKYHDENYYNAYRLYQITDKLDSIFQIQNTAFKFARSSGLNIINKNQKIKDLISDFAMGFN